MSSAPFIKNHSSVFPAIFAGNFQQVSFTGTHAVSSPFSDRTTIIKLFATQDCWIQLGTNPEATASGPDSCIIRGGIIQYLGVYPGWAISVLQASSAGTLDLLEGLDANPE